MKYSVILLTLIGFADLGCVQNIDPTVELARDLQNTQETFSIDKEPVKSTINFLGWYQSKYDNVLSINLINSVQGDTTVYYTLNNDSTNKYLDLFEEGGFVTDQFLNGWRTKFLEMENHLNEDPQNDGPPFGLEYDWVLLTQELEETFIALKDPKVIRVRQNGRHAFVDLNIMMQLRFNMVFIEDRWLVNGIENLGVD